MTSENAGGMVEVAAEPSLEGPESRDALDFAQFFDEYYARVVRGVALFLADARDAEDVAQDAFVRVLERWTAVSTMQSPDGYLFRVAWNAAKRRRRRALLFRQWPEVVETDSMSRAIVRADLLVAIRRLQPIYRDTFVLYEWLDMTTEECGQALGVDAGTVRVRLHRARSQLQAALGGRYGDQE